MKIAFFHELPTGGAKRVVEEYAKKLSKNHDTYLFYTDEKRDKRLEDEFSNSKFYKFMPKRYFGANFKTKLYKDTTELLKLYFLHKKIAKDINKQFFDFIFVHPSQFTHAPFVLRNLEHPVIYYCQEPLRISYDPKVTPLENLPITKKYYEILTRRLRKKIDKENISNANVVLANSKFSKLNIKEAYGLDARVCYLGVDTNKFAKLNIDKKYDLIFIGARAEVDGFDLLEKALSYFKDTPSLKIVERSSKGEGISDLELVQEINKSKISLALAVNEPFGLVPIESMSCGVPVIAVSEGGYKESVVNSKTGFLIERNTSKLFQTITKLLKDNSLRERMSNSSRQHALDRWTWEKSTETLLKIVNKHLGKT